MRASLPLNALRLRLQSIRSSRIQARSAICGPAFYAPIRTFSRYSRFQTSASTSERDQPDLQRHENVVARIRACPGCGGLAQGVEQGQAGYYDTTRKVVRSFLSGSALHENNELPRDTSAGGMVPPPEVPVCDRCHDLLHHNTGVPIHHPSLETLHDTIAESPHKHNHIYHVIDAADFPMSLIDNIHKVFDASLQRSKNRRAKHAGYRYGKRTELSFIITRSDLIAPKKEQVDRLMAYFVSVLRDALGSYAEHSRLGNVRCISAKRGWWTRDLKADIWERGGGGWMVGKVNVGKSTLFEAVFPKGSTEEINVQALRNRSRSLQKEQRQALSDLDESLTARPKERDTVEDENTLLPPAREETSYPIMPVISPLPGTTASPIRIPFGNGKGELVDLPGFKRSSIENFVLPEHRDKLMMKSRVVPEQFSIKQGRSLLLNNLIRIDSVDTDNDPNFVILAYPFVPLTPHLTSRQKAADFQAGTHSERTGLPLITNAEGQQAMRSAGKFKLQWDVTKQRAGPLTSKSGVGLNPKSLPFMVLSTDILIEGIGWVELVAQVRKKRRDSYQSLPADGFHGTKPPQDEPVFYPEVEVFTPAGKFIGCRRPVGAWLLNSPKTKPGWKKAKSRPRRSMATMKKARAPQARE